ncbi:MAG: EAL domain-containing protein [Xanthobacteraceae bacterium]
MTNPAPNHSASSTAIRRPGPIYWLLVCGAILIAAIVLGTTAATLEFRNRALTNNNRERQNTALLLSQHIYQELHSLELVQNDLIEKIHSERIETIEDYERHLSGHDIHLTLRQSIIGLPQVSSIGLLGSTGRLINWSRSWPIPAADFSGRDYFQALKNTSSTDAFISEPILSRGNGAWTIFVARKITTTQGAFLGIIAGGIELSELEKHFSSVTLSEKSSIALFRSDGLLLTRHPPINPAVGHKYPVLFDRLGDADAGTTRLIGKMDGIDRLVSAHRVANFPLVVASTIETSAALADWQEQTRLLIGGGALSILIITIILFLIVRRLSSEYDSSRQKLLLEKQRLDSAIANMPHGVCMFGADQRLVVANDLYSAMYGLSPAQAKPGTRLDAIVQARVAAGSSPRDVERYTSERLKEAFLPESGYIVDELRDGRVIAISRQPMPDGGMVAIHQDITAQKRAEEKILRLAQDDCLTNLANRRSFLEKMRNEVAEHQRSGNSFAVHLLDLDRFKEVNDSLGHSIGDSLLIEVASRLRGCAGHRDLVARLGGDEFAILQTIEGDDAEAAACLAERILTTIGRPFDIGGHQLTIETSVGLALAPTHGTDADELLKRADLALYRAKAAGRNGWRLFTSDMEQEARSHLALAMDFRNSIAQEEFEVHYQPFVSAADESTVGAEALVRWRRLRQVLVGPQEFIPLAEDTGLIIPLGEWILRRACEDAAGWPSNISIAVNISAVQFRSGGLVNVVNEALARSGLAPNRLEIEITESVFLERSEHTLDILHQLRKLGVSIVLDDFGTGYSSLSYLLSFPFDKIKIDRKFVSELARRDDCAAIVTAVTGLARGLNIATTAEGVETYEQLALLRAAGCTLAQGYLFGRPCANSELRFLQAAKSHREGREGRRTILRSAADGY